MTSDALDPVAQENAPSAAPPTIDPARLVRRLERQVASLQKQRESLAEELREARQARRVAEREAAAAQVRLQRAETSLEQREATAQRLRGDNDALRQAREQQQQALSLGRQARLRVEALHRRSAEEVRRLRSAVAALDEASKVGRLGLAFVNAVAQGRPLLEACLEFARAQARDRERAKARAFAHALMREPATAEIGTLCAALHAQRDGYLPLAHHLFGRARADWVERYALAESLDAGLACAPAAARQRCSDWLACLPRPVPEADLARLAALGTTLIAHRQFDLADEVAERLREVAADLDPPTRHWTDRWHALRQPLPTPAAARADEPLGDAVRLVRFALMDYKTLDRDRASANLGDYVQTLASVSSLVRFTQARFRSEVPGLAEHLDGLRSRLQPAWHLAGDPVEVELSLVDRDLPSAHRGPQPQWMLAFGWYMHPNFKRFYDFPLPGHLCPIFVSFHVNDRDFLTEEAVAYLRRWSPVGCRDWTTVYLLRERGIDAFFSGCLTTTVGKLFEAPAAPPEPGAPDIALVDFRDDDLDFDPGQVVAVTHADAAVRERDFLTNLVDADAALQGYRRYRRVVTSRLHCYLPCRSIGVPVDFRPRSLSDIRFEGLVELPDEAFAAMRRRLDERLAAILGHILAGQSVDEVQQAWRALCREDVEQAAAYCARDIAIEPASVDIPAMIEPLRRRALHLSPAPGGDEVVHLAFAVDQHLGEQLPVVLESVLTHTRAPVHAHVLARGLGAAYGQRLAREFGDAMGLSFHDFDAVDYGGELRLLAHTTVSTMDRLLLPELLPELSRVIYLDVDLLVQADLAELWRAPLDGRTLAGKSSTDDSQRQGHDMLYRAARLLPAERAFRLRRAMHAAGPLDFPAFNAGVLLMNLDRLRADGFVHYALPLIARYGLNDQDVLNAHARRDRMELPLVWNAMPSRDVIDGAKILHFAGPVKPWSELYILARESFDAMRQRYLERARRHPA